MNRALQALTLVLIALASFILGAWLAMPSAEKRAQAAQVALTRLAATSRAPIAGRADGTPATADERWSHLLSAFQEPRALRRRFELYEAVGTCDVADLASFLARAEKLPLKFREQVRAALLSRWFEINPQAAAAWVRAGRLSGENVALWAKHAPQDVLDYALSGRVTSWNARTLLRSAVAQLAGPEWPARAAQLAALPPSAARSGALSDTLREWARDDPHAAIEFLSRLSDGQRHEMEDRTILAACATELATRDPAAALRWAAGLPESQRTAPALAAALVHARTEPMAALEWCRVHGIDIASKVDSRFFWQNDSVLNQAMSRQPAETAAWVLALPPGAKRDRLLEHALRSRLRSPAPLAAGARDSALDLYAALPVESQAHVAGLLGAQRGARADFTDLRSWADSLPADERRINALAGAMSGVAQRDTARAEALLATLPAGAERDAALRGLATALAAKTPSEAFPRALEIADPTVRRDTAGDLFAAWRERHRTAAEEWLSATDRVPLEWKAEWIESR